MGFNEGKCVSRGKSSFTVLLGRENEFGGRIKLPFRI